MPRYQDAAQTKPTLRKHAEKELRNILAPINANATRPLAVRGVTFNTLLERYWTNHVQQRKLRRSTLDGYSSMLENWINPFFGDLFLDKITKNTVSEFFTHLRSEGLSAQYRKNVYGLLHKTFEVAEAFDLISHSPVNPMLHRQRSMHGEKPTLPVEKVRAFFEALPEAWRPFFVVLLLTGMRQGELLGLRWQDVDFTSKLIHKRNVVYRGQLVVGLKQTRRTGHAKQHVIGMPPLVENVLKLHKSRSQFTHSECFIFSREDGRPLDPDHIRRYVLYPALKAAEIPVEERGSGLHMFRHTVVSIVAKHGSLKSAQDQAGHSDISTTADIYTHVDAEQNLKNAEILQKGFAAHLLPTLPDSLLNC